MARPTLIFVHGLYMTGACWDGWVRYFEARGHRCLAPSWPGRDGEPAAQRANPPDVLRTLTLDDVVGRIRTLAEGCEESPVLVGHSMGGLVVERLLSEGVGRAAVAICPAPPQGVAYVSWSFLRSNWPVLVPGSAPIVLTVGQFRYAFCHTASEAASEAAYATSVVAESRTLAKSATGPMGRVDFSKDRGPLLMIAAEQDHIIPAALVHRVAARQKAGPGRTDVREFAGRTHDICNRGDWQAVASSVAEWIDAV